MRRRSGCGGCLFPLLIVIFVAALLVRLGQNLPDLGDLSDYFPETEQTTPAPAPTPTPTPDPTPQDTALNLEIPDQRTRYYQLDAIGQELYRGMRESIEDDNVCNFEGINVSAYESRLTEAITALFYDFPEFFWYERHAEYVTGLRSMEVTLVTYDYWDYIYNKEDRINEVYSRITAIAQNAATRTTTYDRIRYVHDYLVDTLTYDFVCVEESTKTVQRASSQQSHNIYGAMMNNLAVCDGYAKSFQMVMNMLGIQCEYVEGDAGGGHAWNYLVLEDGNYWMDVTWDESYTTSSIDDYHFQGINYEYFCITDEEISLTHTPFEQDHLYQPACDATSYNYYIHENFYMETYDRNTAFSIIRAQSGQEIVSMRFGSEAELEKAAQDLSVHQYTASGKDAEYRTLPDYNILYFYYR